MAERTSEDSIERVKVSSTDGDAIIVRYQHNFAPQEADRQDVASCLAAIFDRLNLKLTPADIFEINLHALAGKRRPPVSAPRTDAKKPGMVLQPALHYEVELTEKSAPRM